MNKLAIFIILLFIVGIGTASGQKRISGFVKDKNSGEALVGAIVADTLSRNGTATDNNGFFTLISTGDTVLNVSFLGYATYRFESHNERGTLLTIFLEPSESLEEVVITANRHQNPNVSTLSVAQLMQIPAIGSKPDIGKALQLLPGISTTNEGSSLLLVRGGDPGQNLYLFDNVPVVYVNHLGGFMSVFNPEIINHIDVYKGGFPARYGGRLSSIVDITQREGNVEEARGSLSVGLTDLSFHAEGPLKLPNTTFIIAGRKTLFDPLMALMSGISDGNDFIMFYGFHDVNAKLTWKPNTRNTLCMNLYYGDDYLNYRNKNNPNIPNEHRFTNIWGNWLLSAQWKTVVTDKFFGTTSVSYTRYRLLEKQRYSLATLGGQNDLFEKTVSSVDNFALKTEFKYTPFRNWIIGFGGEAMMSRYRPFHYVTTEEQDRSPRRILTSENALFVDNTLSFLRYSRLQAGVRLVAYNTAGFGNHALEPRISTNLGINRNHFITANYMSVTQHSHLLFTSGGIMNNEVWIPSDNLIRPSRSDQYSVGWSGSFRNGTYTSEVVVFYKTLRDLATYREGFSNLPGDTNWQSKVETGGEGIAKGIELQVKKNTGIVTGFVSYSLSNATRQYPGINNGERFLFDFDRKHQFSVSFNYGINRKLNASATWVYMTGLPHTPAIGIREVPSLVTDENGDRQYYEALLYGGRNSARMRDYHRLDLGLTYETTTKRDRRALWTFSVYNAYNRRNPYSYYYNYNGTGEIIPEQGDAGTPLSLYQISFFPIIPTVSYTLFFDGKSKQTKPTKPANKILKNLLYHED